MEKVTFYVDRTGGESKESEPVHLKPAGKSWCDYYDDAFPYFSFGNILFLASLTRCLSLSPFRSSF